MNNKKFYLMAVLACLLCSCKKSLPKVTGRVFLDSNSNQILDPDEQGISGLKVSIANKAGRIWETKTDSNGRYVFDSLDVRNPEGTYLLGIAIGTEYEFVNPQQNFTVRSPPYATLDMPLKRRTDNQTLGGFVFVDSN